MDSGKTTVMDPIPSLLPALQPAVGVGNSTEGSPLKTSFPENYCYLTCLVAAPRVSPAVYDLTCQPQCVHLLHRWGLCGFSCSTVPSLLDLKDNCVKQ